MLEELLLDEEASFWLGLKRRKSWSEFLKEMAMLCNMDLFSKSMFLRRDWLVDKEEDGEEYGLGGGGVVATLKSNMNMKSSDGTFWKT